MPDTGCTELLQCVVCGRSSEKRCGRCRGAAYCGRQHQTLHWRVHRPICSSAGPRSPTLLLLDDTLLLVFGLLSNEDLVTAGQVCARWRRLARRPSLWAKRRVVMEDYRDNDTDGQVLRVLRFAPRLAELNSEWTSLRWPPESDYAVAMVEPHNLELAAVQASLELSCLRVYKPGPLVLNRFGGSLQELTITTSSPVVLAQLGTLEAPRLKRLSLRWDDAAVTPVMRNYERLLQTVAEKHADALYSLLGWRLWSGDSSSSAELLAALARCPGLRELWVPASAEVTHLSLLAALPLRLLVLDCSCAYAPLEAEQLPGLTLPPSLHTLSVKVPYCPLNIRLASELGRVCAGLPSLQELRVRPYDPSDDPCEPPEPPDDPHPLEELRAALGPGVQVNCHCNCDVYDFGEPEDHEVPPEDRAFGAHFNSLEDWDDVMNNLGPGVLDDFDDDEWTSVESDSLDDFDIY